MNKEYQYFKILKALFDYDFEKWFISTEHNTECLRHDDLPFDLAVKIFESEKEKQAITEVSTIISNGDYYIRYQVVVESNNEQQLIKPKVAKKE